MGMYAADLGYVRHFEKIQLCTRFLDAVNILSNKLAIGNKEFNKMIPEFEQNLDNKKHIFTLIDSLINNSSLFLSGNEQYGLSVLFLSGFWIESSYIGMYGIHNNELEHHKQIISEHFKILNQIIYIFSYVRDEDILDILKNDLMFLESKYSTNDFDLSHIEAIREKYKKE